MARRGAPRAKAAAPARRAAAPAAEEPSAAAQRRTERPRARSRASTRGEDGEPAVAGAALLPHAAVGTAGAVRDLSDSSLIVRLTRGRGWIAVLGVLLGGIVALNVVTLSLTAGTGRIALADRRARAPRTPRFAPSSPSSSPRAGSRRRPRASASRSPTRRRSAT